MRLDLVSLGTYKVPDIRLQGIKRGGQKKAFVQGVTTMRKTMATPHSARPRPGTVPAVIPSITP